MLYPEHRRANEKEMAPMANENLFTSLVGKLIPPTDAINEEQAPAYAFSAKHKLAPIRCDWLSELDVLCIG